MDDEVIALNLKLKAVAMAKADFVAGVKKK
jgi:hypothetical protein